MSNVLKLSVVLLVFSSLGFALPACQDTTLDWYVAQGSDGCTIGDKIFYNFVFSLNPAIPEPGVEPEVIGDVKIKPGQSGQTMILDFTGTDFVAALGGSGNVSLYYTVKTASGAATIQSGQLGLDGEATGLAFASVNESFCLGQDTYDNACKYGETMQVNVLPGVNGGVDNVLFNPLVSKVAVYKDIALYSAGLQDLVHFSTMTQSWTQVPEPGAAFALLMGLGGIGYALRRRRTV